MMTISTTHAALWFLFHPDFNRRLWNQTRSADLHCYYSYVK